MQEFLESQKQEFLLSQNQEFLLSQNQEFSLSQKQEFLHFQKSVVDRINTYLEKCLATATNPKTPSQLLDAMRYPIQNGGKRLRPLLVYATGKTLNIPFEALDAAAAAVELIHCYSLVHDDLPAMDNDDLRRGKPTCHIAYNEATAILVGDALHTLAFHILSSNELNKVADSQKIKMIHTLTEAIGSEGMIGGQALDIACEGKEISVDALKEIHHKKTGALITASILLALHAAPSVSPLQNADMNNVNEILRFQEFGLTLGLLFQVQDDILDVVGDTKTLGKTKGKDITLEKATFPKLLGLQSAQAFAETLYQKTIAVLESIEGSAFPLVPLLHYLHHRQF